MASIGLMKSISGGGHEEAGVEEAGSHHPLKIASSDDEIRK
jgi:hypothetical protein